MTRYTIPIYQVDAFSSQPFKGNPAAVCMMKEDLPDHTLQCIAAENNLAETAYIWHHDHDFHIRWFTPTIEVDLCGHATLAAAFILFYTHTVKGDRIKFNSRSGPLYVTRESDGRLVLDFPVDQYISVDCPAYVETAIHCQILDFIKGKSDYLARVVSENALKSIIPDFSLIKQLPSRGLIVTAPGDTVDFVSRCFFPQSGIDEDPVTGSAHTTLTPYWALLLGRNTLTAKQVSLRGGDLYCSLQGDRVFIGGYASLFLEGQIFVYA
ncbi:MAG: PhzF family phenazine biosynthesis protein [Saprospiraceae bacterium]